MKTIPPSFWLSSDGRNKIGPAYTQVNGKSRSVLRLWGWSDAKGKAGDWQKITDADHVHELQRFIDLKKLIPVYMPLDVADAESV